MPSDAKLLICFVWALIHKNKIFKMQENFWGMLFRGLKILIISILGIENPKFRQEIQTQMQFQGIEDSNYVISAELYFDKMQRFILIVTLAIVAVNLFLFVGFLHIFHRYSVSHND